jgi:hypothetical protein
MASAGRRAEMSSSARSSTAAPWISVNRAISPRAQSSPWNSSRAAPPHIPTARSRVAMRSLALAALATSSQKSTASTGQVSAYPLAPVTRASGPSTVRSRDTDLRSAPGVISSTSASQSVRSRCGVCNASNPRSLRWLALGTSTMPLSGARARTLPSTQTSLITDGSPPTILRFSRWPSQGRDAISRGQARFWCCAPEAQLVSIVWNGSSWSIQTASSLRGARQPSKRRDSPVGPWLHGPR